MNKIKNLVLKASAGTGKTYRLSLEYIIALSKKGDIEPIDYKNILVMTFTRKATAEIKEGILNKLSEFITVEEYEEVMRGLVSFANESLGVADFKASPQINKIDSIFDLELEKVINSFSWYDGYDLKSYLDLLLKRAWELTYIKQAKERELYPDFKVLPIYFILISLIMFSTYYEKTNTMLDYIIPNFDLYGTVLIFLFGVSTFFKNRFIRKVLQISSDQKFNVKSTLDFIRLNKTTLGEFNVLFFSNSIIYDMREWVSDRRFISDNWDDNEKNNYLTLYKYYFEDK